MSSITDAETTALGFARMANEQQAKKLVHALQERLPHSFKTLALSSRNGHTNGHDEEPDCDPVPGSGPVQPFPTRVLPEPLRRLVTEGSRNIQCPEDFIAAPLLAFIGVAIGTSREIEVKPGWREGPRVYLAIVADPGSAKSPALELACGPVHARQRVLQKQYDCDYGAYQVDLGQFEADIRRWQTQAQKGTAGTRPVKPEEPSLSQVYTTDATLEALSPLLLTNPRGLMLYRDELTGWVLSMNQYKGGKGADRQSWLSFWNGAPSLINRKSHKPLFLERPFVSVCGCLPPDTLPDLADERGREDGFLHRILFSWPARYPRAWSDDVVDESTMGAVMDVFEMLWGLDPEDAGGSGLPLRITFTPPAKAAWVEWISEHYRESSSPAFPDNLRGPWAKLEGYAARLALILQMARWASGEARGDEIDPRSVAGAATLVAYFKEHARRVYSRLRSTPEDQSVLQAVDWIRRNGGAVTARDVQRAGLRDVRTSEEAKILLQRIADRGWGALEVLDRGGVRFQLHESTRHSTQGAGGQES